MQRVRSWRARHERASAVTARVVASILATQRGKEDDIADGALIGEEHDEAVESECDPAVRSSLAELVQAQAAAVDLAELEPATTAYGYARNAILRKNKLANSS